MKNSTKGSGWMAFAVLVFAAIVATLMYYREEILMFFRN
jgi:hypothetical protein